MKRIMTGVPAIISENSILALREMDSHFDQIFIKYGAPPNWSRTQGFDSLVRIILEQQVSLESGKAAFEKLQLMVPSFTPAEIGLLTVEKMRKATISRQKASYILGLAEAVQSQTLDIENLRNESKERCYDLLTSIRGIGPWTARVYMLFSLQHQDIFPTGDIALIHTVKELWGVGSKEDVYLKATQWSPYRSAASFFLWHYYLSKRGRSHVS